MSPPSLPSTQRVLLVVNTFPPGDISGVGEQVAQLEQHLRERGWDVTLARRGVASPGAIAIRGPKALFPLLAAVQLLPRLLGGEFDLVQVHESDGALVAAMARFTAPLGRRRRAIVSYFQVSYIREMRSIGPTRVAGRTVLRPVWRELVFKYARAPLHVILGILSGVSSDLILAPSSVTLAEVLTDYNLEGRRSAVLPNCMRSFAAEETVPPLLRQRQEQGDRRPAFLYTGRLRTRKGLDFLFLAIAQLYRRGHQPVLFIAGDGENRHALERFASWLEISPAVHFLGKVTHGALRHYFRASRALVVPSLYEGMPLVVLEAMVHGTPVVASRVSGIPEVIEDGVQGQLVPAADHIALADALERYIKDPAAATRHGQAARATAEARFERQQVGERLEALYRELLESSSVGRFG